MPIDLLEQKNISLVEEPPRDLLSAKEPPVSKDGFDEWYSGWAKTTGISPDPDDPRHHYDYRAAYKAGASPKIDPSDKLYHWPSQFKAPDHPTRFVNGIDTITGEPVPEPNPSMLREMVSIPETALHLGAGVISSTAKALLSAGKLGYDLLRGKEQRKAYKESAEFSEDVIGTLHKDPLLPETRRNMEYIGAVLGFPQRLAEWTDKQIGEILPAYAEFSEYVPKSKWGTFLEGLSREGKSFASAVLTLGTARAGGSAVKGKLVERAGRESPETLKAIREQVAKDKLLVEERAPIDLLAEKNRFQPAEGKPPFYEGVPGTEPTEYTPIDRGRGVPLRPPQELTPEGIVSTRAELGDYAETPEIPAPVEPPYRGGIPGTEPTEYIPLDRGRGVPLRPTEELTPEGVVGRRAELGDYGEPVETPGPVYPPFRGEMKPSVVETLEHPTIEPVMGTPTPKPPEPFIPEALTPPGPRPTDTFKSREDARLRSLMGEPVKKSPAPTTAPLSEPIAGVEGKALPGQGKPSTPVEVPPPTSPAPLSFANPPERSGTYPAVKSGDTAFIGEGHIGAIEAAGLKGIGVESLEDGFVQYPSGRWLTRDQMTDLIKNNRGETTIPMELANYVIEGAKKAGKSVDEFLKNRKGALATLRLTKEDIAAIIKISKTGIQEKKEAPTSAKQTVEPIYKETFPTLSPDKVIKQRPLGTKDNRRYAPAITKEDFQNVIGAKELRNKPLGGMTETAPWTFEEAGEGVKETLYYPMREAQHAAHLEKLEVNKRIKDLQNEVSRKSGDRIGIYAIAKQPGGMDLLKSAKIEKVPTLTEAEMGVYNKIRGELETYYNRLNEVRESIGKEGFGKREDYFTFFRNLSIWDRLGISPILTRADKLPSYPVHPRSTFFRFALPRTEGVFPLEINAFDVFRKYAHSASDHIHKSPTIALGRELLGTFKIDGKPYLLKDSKPNLAKFLTDWLDWQTGIKPPTRVPKLIDYGLQKLNSNLTFSVLSGYLRSAFIQPTSLLLTAVELGPKYTAQGIWDFISSAEKRAEAMSKSKHIAERKLDVAIAEAYKNIFHGAGKIKSEIGKAGFWPLQALDVAAAKATWLGANRMAKDMAKGEKASERFADDIVIKTQGSASRTDISPAQRTTVGKSLSLFQTFTINQWNYLLKEAMGVGNAKISKPEAFKKLMYFAIGSALISSFYEDVLQIPSPLPTPIRAFTTAMENDESPLVGAKNAALEITQLLPYLGGARYGGSPLGATADFIKDVASYGAAKAIKKPWWELAGKGLGVPGMAQIARSVKGAQKERPPMEILFGQTESSYMKGLRGHKQKTISIR